MHIFYRSFSYQLTFSFNRLNDVVQSEGRLYLVFEFVDRDLKKFLDSSVEMLTHERLLAYVWQLLEGIEYCHVRGVIHR